MAALEASDPDTLLGVLDAHFDLDALLTTIAVDLLTAWVQSDLHGYAADTVATLAPDCEADPRAEIPCLPEDVLGFLADRPGKVAAELAAGP